MSDGTAGPPRSAELDVLDRLSSVRSTITALLEGRWHLTPEMLNRLADLLRSAGQLILDAPFASHPDSDTP